MKLPLSGTLIWRFEIYCPNSFRCNSFEQFIGSGNISGGAVGADTEQSGVVTDSIVVYASLSDTAKIREASLIYRTYALILLSPQTALIFLTFLLRNDAINVNELLDRSNSFELEGVLLGTVVLTMMLLGCLKQCSAGGFALVSSLHAVACIVTLYSWPFQRSPGYDSVRSLVLMASGCMWYTANTLKELHVCFLCLFLTLFPNSFRKHFWWSKPQIRT